MKNLKRTLCLVLALVLAVGLLTVGAGAAFKDDAQITYKEAVDLLAGLGVINGYEDGSFQPKGNFDRGGLAKMVAYFCWGGADKSALYAGANVFSDINSYAWAKGSINYGYNAGYISGAGTDKDGKLIYNPAGTVKGSELAKTLLVVLGYKANAEDPAYALVGSNWELNSVRLAEKEGLFANLAASFNPIAALTREEAAQIFANALTKGIYTQYNKDNTPVTTVVDGTPMTKFFTGWSATPDQTDAFGRPVTQYTKGSTTVNVGNNATLTYTTEVTAAKIFADLHLNKNITAATYTDGVGTTDTLSLEEKGTGKIGGNGTVTEVFYDAVAGTVKIVVINSYFETVTAIEKATATTKEKAVTATGEFEVTGLAVDDNVIITKADTAIKSMQKVLPSELTATSIVNGQSFVAGGKTYQYNKTCATKLTGAAGDFTAKKVFVDSYGYVINISGISVDPNYAVVLTTDKTGTTDWVTGTTVYQAQILLANGTVEVVKAADNYDTLKNTIVTYTVNNGVYTLKTAGATAETGTLSINKGAAAFTFDAAYNANAKTIFLVRSGEGTTVSPYTYASYTGIANVPSLTGGSAAGEVLVASSFAKVVYITGATVKGATSSESVFVSGVYAANTVMVNGTPVTYYTAQALVNGKLETLNFSSNYAKGLYTVKSSDANGYVTLATTAGTAITGIAKYVADSGVITINSTVYALASNVAVYTYSTSTGAISTASISAIVGTETAGLFTVDKDNTNVVTSIFVPVA